MKILDIYILPNIYDLGLRFRVPVLKMLCAVSNLQYSLNFLDCFSGACIIVSIETKDIYIIHCLLPSYNK